MAGYGDLPGTGELRDEVARAWRRVALTGLAPDTPAPPEPADPAGAPPPSRVAEVAAPVLGELTGRLAGTGLSVLLADRDHRIVHAWLRTPSLPQAFGGSCAAESVLGNNVAATPVETGRETWIHGAEHYLRRLRPFSGLGVPLRHPLTRRVEGAVAILGAAPRADALLGPVLAGVARDVQARLLDCARAEDRRLLAAFQRVARRHTVPVAVTGGDVVLANRAFTEAIGTADPGLLRALLPEIPRRGTLVRSVDLGANGRVSVVAERVDGTADGVLYRLGDRVDQAVTPTPPGRARRAERGVLVAGEPGTGRTRAALAEAGHVPVVRLDALAALPAGEREWAAEFLRIVARHNGAVVVEDAHLLPELACAVVRRVLDGARVRLVLTTCPVAELPPLAARLAGRCATRIELAPLRERLHELPALLAAMGAFARPDRSWTLTARAVEALCTNPWDGNLVELAALVDELAARPGTGLVDLDDLPARYRRTGRTARLGGRERAERLAIIGALRSADGNKLRAAAQLGISRTTLYRRMQALDITDRAAG